VNYDKRAFADWIDPNSVVAGMATHHREEFPTLAAAIRCVMKLPDDKARTATVLSGDATYDYESIARIYARPDFPTADGR
jgi:hypothetical protein